MIPLSTSSLDLQELKKAIKIKMKHKYLKKYFKDPIIDEEKLLVLTMVISHTSFTKEKKQELVIASTLVQVAIDIHDLAPEGIDLDESEAEITLQQLNVLGGDYYSGLYYLLLSDLEEIGMVHAVASAVKEISELKMKLYYKEFNTFKEYIEIVKKIETLVIVTISKYLNQEILSSLAGKLILAAKLQKNILQYQVGESAPIIDQWNSISTDENRNLILQKMESAIKENTDQIEKVLSYPTSELSPLKTQISHLLNKLIYDITPVSEEG